MDCPRKRHADAIVFKMMMNPTPTPTIEELWQSLRRLPKVTRRPRPFQPALQGIGLVAERPVACPF